MPADKLYHINKLEIDAFFSRYCFLFRPVNTMKSIHHRTKQIQCWQKKTRQTAREYQKHEMNRHTKKKNLLLYFAVPFFDFHHVISVVPIWISAGNLHEHNHSAISGSRCRLLFFPYAHIHLRNNEIIFNRKRIARVHFHSTAVIKAPYRSQSMENMNSSSVAINSIRFCYLTDSIVINKSEIIYAIFARSGSALNECRGNQMTKWKSRPKLTLPLGRY